MSVQSWGVITVLDFDLCLNKYQGQWKKKKNSKLNCNIMFFLFFLSTVTRPRAPAKK
jgi:hypothetical protein